MAKSKPNDASPRLADNKRAFSAFMLLLLAVHLTVVVPSASQAASREAIDADVNATLHSFVSQNPGAQELGNKAAGVLVFPSLLKAGFGFGGEYGEGLLLIHGKPAGYYNLVSASFGFQIGVQARSVIIMFMTNEALAAFDRRAGWRVGVDGSVVFVTLGAGGSIDTDKITNPVIGFVIDLKGLMYNLTLEGSKISRISR